MSNFIKKMLSQDAVLLRQVRKSLTQVKDPLLGQDIISLGWLPKLQQRFNQQNDYVLLLHPRYPLTAQQQTRLRDQVLDCLVGQFANHEIKLQFDSTVASYSQAAPTQRRLQTVNNMIAIASGKGGVGKSTTAVQFALALRRLQLQVGLLDADIYGPNQPHLLGVDLQRARAAAVAEDKQFMPQLQHGICSMSLGYLLDAKAPIVWRGPMVSGALQQLLNDTQWPQLDHLVVDMPPGTGDVQLTLSKKYALSGAVIVTTPQAMALQDARRAIEMFRKVKVPILGVIENMSYHVCTNCQHHQPLFGEGGAAALAEEYGVPFLAQIPLSIALRDANAVGDPLFTSPAPTASVDLAPSMMADGSLPQAASTAAHAAAVAELQAAYMAAAQRALAELSLQAAGQSAKFPPVVVE